MGSWKFKANALKICTKVALPERQMFTFLCLKKKTITTMFKLLL